MSVLVIGGDKINSILEMLKSLGATSTTHWDSRRRSTSHKKIPTKTDAIIMISDFLSHNSMYQFKKDAKEQNIPLIYARRGVASVASEFDRFLKGGK
ncbi:MAG: DUF2325 domain-containing protein [Sulfurimonas sp.]|jgi:hypothetical protein|nr:DUF2325 domain-containing protein [Sulfurimonadaceae bacterium]